jgi:NADH-quinone oxidoreductase subunit C
MNATDIATLVSKQFGSAVLEQQPDGSHAHLVVTPDAIVEVCNFLRNNELLKFELLRCITAIDWPEKQRIELSYDLLSIEHGHTLAVKVRLDRSVPKISSVSDIWPAANWHEREAYDLMGVTFIGHPELLRILLPEDWAGHPLRKDYVDPEEYHGITAKR